MKILNSKQPSMDNKLKFSDRFKVLVNTDTQKGTDPYVFNDTEQPFVVSTGGKNIKLIAPKNSKTPSTARSKSKGKCLKTKIKTEPVPGIGFKTEPGLDITGSTSKHIQQSQYELQQRERYLKKLQRFKAKRRNRDHTLQYYPRAGDEISDSESSADELQIYQRHWYSGEPDPTLARSTRLSQLHSQLQRQLQQLQCDDEEMKQTLKDKARTLLEAAVRDPTAAGRILNDATGSAKITDGPLIIGGPCGVEGCLQISLPSTRHCSRHIMLNSDQLLFEHCTAKFSDNTQCCIPVFDVAHELPLCPEHARKRDNYHRRAQESKPKKARSKKPTSPSTAPTQTAAVTPKPSKPKSSRPKKRKRPPTTGNSNNSSKMEIKVSPIPAAVAPVLPTMPMPLPTSQMPDESLFTSHIISASEVHTKTLNNINAPPQTSSNIVKFEPTANLNNLGLDIGSLGLGPGLKVELDDHEVFASLGHATEHDFENVLNNLPADAFNDLFIGNFATASVGLAVLKIAGFFVASNGKYLIVKSHCAGVYLM